MSEKEKNINTEPILESINDDELDSVSGGKGFAGDNVTIADRKNSIKSNKSSFI